MSTTEPAEGSRTSGATAVATAQAGGEIVTAASLWGDAWHDLRRRVIFWVSAVIMLLIVAMAAVPWLFTDAGPNSGCNARLAKREPTSWNPFVAGAHPFGYDMHGCDYWSQVVNGARAPVVIGFSVTAIALVVAVTLGSLSGYFGGVVDMLISRFTDIVFGLPLVLGALVMLTAFPSHAVWAVALVLSAFWWTTMTRIMRGQVLSVREADYVQAARMLGAGNARIILRHILPNAIAPVFVYAMLNVGVVIGSEATLDFLGVGLQYPTVSWGRQLAEAQDALLDYPYLLIYPGVFLTAAVLSFLLLGDAIRDALDPRMR